VQVALKAEIAPLELGRADVELPVQAQPGEMVELPGRLHGPAGVAKQRAASHRPVTGPTTDDPVVLVERR